MKQLYTIFVKQLITGYVGAGILLFIYKIKGRDISYDQILNEIDPKSGIKKYYYKAFYLGVGFFILLVFIISTLMGLNPKLYDPNT